MGSSLTNVLLLVVALAIGIAVTFFGTGLLNDSGLAIDQQTQIILAVVISLFAFVAFYFMAKGRGGG